MKKSRPLLILFGFPNTSLFSVEEMFLIPVKKKILMIDVYFDHLKLEGWNLPLMFFAF